MTEGFRLYDKLCERYVDRMGDRNPKVPVTEEEFELFARKDLGLTSVATIKNRWEHASRLKWIVTDAERSYVDLDELFGPDRIEDASLRDDMQAVREVIRDHMMKSGKGISLKMLARSLADRMDDAKILLVLDKMTKKGEVYSPAFDIYRLIR